MEELRPGAKVFVQSAGGRARVIYDAVAFEAARDEQRSWLAKRWIAEGLPGSVSVLHPLSGEMDLLPSFQEFSQVGRCRLAPVAASRP